MSNSQSNSEFVETAFTAEEVEDVELKQIRGDGDEVCAFLDGVHQPAQQPRKNQSS